MPARRTDRSWYKVQADQRARFWRITEKPIPSESHAFYQSMKSISGTNVLHQPVDKFIIQATDFKILALCSSKEIPRMTSQPMNEKLHIETIAELAKYKLR